MPFSENIGGSESEQFSCWLNSQNIKKALEDEIKHSFKVQRLSWIEKFALQAGLYVSVVHIKDGDKSR